LPSLREIPPSDVRLLPGRLAGLFDIRRQLWQRVEYSAEASQNEKASARRMVQELPKGSLLVTDLATLALPGSIGSPTRAITGSRACAPKPATRSFGAHSASATRAAIVARTALC
jgi:hypothetical protein